MLKGIGLGVRDIEGYVGFKPSLETVDGKECYTIIIEMDCISIRLNIETRHPKRFPYPHRWEPSIEMIPKLELNQYVWFTGFGKAGLASVESGQRFGVILETEPCQMYLQSVCNPGKSGDYELEDEIFDI